MGTLSGGGKQIISIGERCLLGAESGIGIALGDELVVEAGLFMTTGTRVTLPDGQVVKALELSGADNILFRRDFHTASSRRSPTRRSGAASTRCCTATTDGSRSTAITSRGPVGIPTGPRVTDPLRLPWA